MRSDDEWARSLFAPLSSHTTQATITAERSFLARLYGGCQVPIGALATVQGENVRLRGMISSVDGLTLLRGERWGTLHAPERLGIELAEDLLQHGGDAILRDIYGSSRPSER
jgi:hydroxymethylbilane synthase